MTPMPHPLDAARRRWLSGLEAAYHGAPSADTALAFARGCWMCGEYDAAIAAFEDAARRAPDQAEHQLALVRAASMLGLRDLEDATLQAARARHPHAFELALHAALRRCPDDLAGAAALLAPFVAHPQADVFHRALVSLQTGEAPAESRLGAPDLDACWDSFRWMHRHAASQAFAGLPVDVMTRALSARAGRGHHPGVRRVLRPLAAADRRAHRCDGPRFSTASKACPKPGARTSRPAPTARPGDLPTGLPANVALHRGWFEDTLPCFFAATPGDIRLLHIDCDLYSSTRTVLQCADDRLVPGSVLLFDDFLGYPGYEGHELRAFEEFVNERGVGWEVVAGCLLGREVAIRITSR